MSTNVAIIGTGRVGATIAYTLTIKNMVSQLVLIDSNTERCEGEMRDLTDVLAFSETAHITQGGISDARAADIIIITAGFAQQGAEETRLELLNKNRAVVESIMEQLGAPQPHAIILLVTNPVDLMTFVAQKKCPLSTSQIFGSGTWLDTQRLRRYLAEELSVAPESIDAFVIGEHGDNQCVAWSQAHVGGVHIAEAGISAAALNAIAAKTVSEAYNIIKRKCATYYGIAACVADICETIIFDQKRIVPVSCWNPDLEVCLSAPVILGKRGIERNLVMNLSSQERGQLRLSAQKLKEFMDSRL